MSYTRFRIWVIGFSRYLESNNILHVFDNLDSKKLITTIFNAMAIKLGEEEFHKLSFPWVPKLSYLPEYKLWREFPNELSFIIIAGISQLTHRRDKGLVIPEHPHESIFKSMLSLNHVWSNTELNSQMLLSLEKLQRAELVTTSPHRYGDYDKFWNTSVWNGQNAEQTVILNMREGVLC